MPSVNKVTMTLSVFMCVGMPMCPLCHCLLCPKEATQLLFICPYSSFLETPLPSVWPHTGAEGEQDSDISKEQPFGLARMQSIIQAGYGVVHCIRANVNMIPYPVWNSSYVAVPLQANITRERKQCEIHWDNSFIVVTIVASITSRVCWFAKSGTIQYL